MKNYKTNKCGNCNADFRCNIKIGNKWHNGTNRKFCYVCSPFGTKDCRHPKDRIKDTDGCRTCSTCKERLPLESFSKKSSESSGRGWLCKQCSSKYVINRQKLVKQKCIDYKGGSCESCGYKKCNRALHFHHKDRSQKNFMIATYRCRAWEVVQQELDEYYE